MKKQSNRNNHNRVSYTSSSSDDFLERSKSSSITSVEEEVEEETTNRLHDNELDDDTSAVLSRLKSDQEHKRNHNSTYSTFNSTFNNSCTLNSLLNNTFNSSVNSIDCDRSVATCGSKSVLSASRLSLPREIELDGGDEVEDNNDQETNLKDNDNDRSSSSLEEEQTDCDKKRRAASCRSLEQLQQACSAAANDAVDGSCSNDGAIDDLDTFKVERINIRDPYGEPGEYTGFVTVSNGIPHGHGRIEYYNDCSGRSGFYEGHWCLGRWTGTGRFQNGFGDRYYGGWKNDLKHGRGNLKYADGRTFRGTFDQDTKVHGLMKYTDGSRYTGGWSATGNPHGIGECVYSDGGVYEGEYNEGKIHGRGTMTWADGGWYSGDWNQGRMDGYGKEVRPDGSVRHEGKWKADRPIRRRK